MEYNSNYAGGSPSSVSGSASLRPFESLLGTADCGCSLSHHESVVTRVQGADKFGPLFRWGWSGDGTKSRPAIRNRNRRAKQTRTRSDR
ncbi:hypothetical protein CERZMDRAFT_91512 [Cercospora zeae-maydis SCOH1-5]|uniref:Uncharacterized protein n=1 Tax=Cercospora zeae-maydis SCOH1-5 TaxID=717836 RepID=A0A6A6F7X4_9PEZI|nr:hypothetical protein CERZMDRAFT_91512 [Cercospora zeae-maydis SCOH1-5]